MKKLFLTLVLCCFAATPTMAKKDKNMTCAEIQTEMEELSAIEASAGGAATADTAARTGAAVATQGAIMAGAGSSIPFIGGLANIATSVSKGNVEIKKQKAAEASKRLIKLDTIAEMKDCYE